MNSEKILFETPKFNIVDRDGNHGIVSTIETVMVIPFISDDQGLPLMVGVMKEKNQFRDGGFTVSLLTGTCDSEDPDYLETAKRELAEETGYSVDDNSKWNFLGSLNSVKFLDKEFVCFSVDVSNIQKGERIDSEENRNSEFHFIPANDVVKSNDVFIPALFLKLFKFVVGMDLYNRDDSTFGKSEGFDVEI